MARPSWKPSDEQRRLVEAMAGYGTPEDDIAKVLLVSPKTLRKHCRTELDTAHIRANDRVKETLFRIATGRAGNPARDRSGNLLFDKDGNVVIEIDWKSAAGAAQFWTARRCGWHEQTAVEHSGSIDNPSAQHILILPDNGR